MRKFAVLAGALLVMALGFLAGGGSASVPPGTLVMSGLDNPRHLTFGPGHALYVAEAGRGGPGPCSFIRGETQCAGTSGAISRLRHGVSQRVVTGLPSYAPASGNGATGPHAVSLRGGGSGHVTIGLGGDLTRRATMGDGFGRIFRFHSNGSWAYADDLAAYEQVNNPDGNVPDSNPYDVLAVGGGRVATDAGGNDLLHIRSNGSISTLAVFPSRPGRSTDAVPTSVARGEDGAYYVGELTGVPFNAGVANVYRVRPGHAPTVYRSGFTAIIDIAWGPDDHLYVLQFASGPGLTGPGVLYRVERNGPPTPVVTGLFTPGGIAFGEDNNTVYITQGSILAGGGTVSRYDLGDDDEEGEH